MIEFFLGTHETSWLGRASVPLFVSRRRLAGRKTLPRAPDSWALDSGGFSELNLFGRWETGPWRYADEVRRYRDAIGGLRWAAIQDWMCEPFILAKTRKAIVEHQGLTVGNLHQLRGIAPDLPWMPVLQGWHVDDYLHHVDLYSGAGVDLRKEPIVGVGSVCRRQGTREAVEIFSSLARLGLKLHGFGLKTQGIAATWPYLASADSLAWSYQARRRPPLVGCVHKSCANCLRYALGWRERVLRAARRPCQLQLALDGAA